MLSLYDVKHVFGLPGETTLDLYDHWFEHPEIEHILTRGEKNSAFMAEAYSKVTGKPFCTDISKSADYLMVAQAFGLQCHRLQRHAEIESVLDKALGHDGPSFIEMPVVSQDVIAPFVPKWVHSARQQNIPNIY